MVPTILQTEWERKVSQQMDLGLLQEVLPMSQRETLLDTYQMWEQRERKLNSPRDTQRVSEVSILRLNGSGTLLVRRFSMISSASGL